MAMAAPKGEDDVVTDINITPLCDIFVVLLIIFMVTADQIVQTGPSVDLPVNTVASEQPSTITVTITEQDRYFVGDEEVSVDRKAKDPFAQLAARLKDEIGKSKEPAVMIRSDKRRTIRDVMRVKDIADRAGASQVAIGTRLEK